MIVRILSEGQWVLDDDALPELNDLDSAVEAAVQSGDQSGLTRSLTVLLARVRELGRPVPDEMLVDSDLILPDDDASLAEVRDLLGESTDGLVPG